MGAFWYVKCWAFASHHLTGFFFRFLVLLDLGYVTFFFFFSPINCVFYLIYCEVHTQRFWLLWEKYARGKYVFVGKVIYFLNIL